MQCIVDRCHPGVSNRGNCDSAESPLIHCFTGMNGGCCNVIPVVCMHIRAMVSIFMYVCMYDEHFLTQTNRGLYLIKRNKK